MLHEPLLVVLGVEINAFVVMLAAAAAVALPLALWTARASGLPAALALDTWFAGAVAFVGGAALVPTLLRPLLGDLGTTWSLGGLAVLLAAEAALVHVHPAARKARALALGVALVPLPLAQVLGRLGCFTAGCCHGRPAWTLPWAVTFPAGSASAYQGVPVHPTQLYEAAGLAVIFAALLALWRRPHTRPLLLGAYFAGYGVLRFVVEGFRGDLRPMVGALSLNQVLCITAAVAGAALLARGRARAAAPSRAEAS